MTPDRPRSPAERRAFTFIELMVVVVLLGIMAALVVPQFSNAAALARESTLRDELRNLRSQIAVYAAQHRATNPGYPGGNTAAAPTAAAFADQLTSYTDEQGRTAQTPDAVFKFGPYLRLIPRNPFTNHSTVRIVPAGPFPAAPLNTHAWVYQPSTGKIAPDNSGKDAAGIDFFAY
jgi:general secretion pathway protein G